MSKGNGQSRIESVLETLTNTFIGMLVALAAQRIIFPLYGIDNSYATDIQIVAWFTGVSILRGYLIRRFWNARPWAKQESGNGR